MYSKLKATVDRLQPETINKTRQETLQLLIDYLMSKVAFENIPKLNFICTHNARRSHLSQVWAQTMAHHMGIQIQTFSGGMEATAFHTNAVAAIKRAGFQVETGIGSNPRYKVSFSEDTAPMVCYSKAYDDKTNPSADFAAVMTCSDADEACPVVAGADVRIKLLYEDPKVSDGTDHEHQTYDERSTQIATEMKYIFETVKKRMSKN